MTGRLGLGCLVGCAGPLIAFIILCGGVGILAGSCAVAAEQVVPAPASISGIPPAYLVLYEQAGQRFGLQWQILAGIGYSRDPPRPSRRRLQSELRRSPRADAVRAGHVRRSGQARRHRQPEHLRPGGRHPRGRGAAGA